MSQALIDYFAALERLKRRNAKINNDTVAEEAGRQRGSIKKSRPQFTALIAAIDIANEQRRLPAKDSSGQLEKVKKRCRALQGELDAAFSRELSLLREVFELRKELVQLRGGKVVPIRESHGGR